MRIPRIHTSQDLKPQASFDLEPGPSQHLSRALRMQEGDALVLFDGSGGQYPATISAVGKKQVSVRTAAFEDRDVESPLDIHLGIAISRGDRMDWVVQKATELGVSRITPLLTERTEVKLKGERAEKKIAHWQQVAVSACEQCGRNRVPLVAPLTHLSSWMSEADAELKLVLHHRASTLPVADNPPGNVALLIGPEGGLSAEEISSAENSGYLSLRLGPRVLRT